jgi:cysteinyl-tRNA synthetase
LMDIILDVRQRYREAQDWAQADTLRRRLMELGIAVDDQAEGSTWRVEPRG